MKIVFILKLLRPVQWLKNLMLVFPPFLGGAIMQPGMAAKLIMPVASFCLASSATYVFNDLMDSANDVKHPVKRSRSIAAGVVTKKEAIASLLILLAVAVYLAFHVSSLFVVLLLAYVSISSLYSVVLKELPLVDIFCISAGFLLRLQAGGEAFGVSISEWLFLTVFLLSLFLSTGKRLCEHKELGECAGLHRKSLMEYPEGFLEGMLYLTASSVLVTYAMYAISRVGLVYTVPLCTFGLLRYIFRVKNGSGGDPTEALLQDIPLFVVGSVWVLMVGIAIYS